MLSSSLFPNSYFQLALLLLLLLLLFSRLYCRGVRVETIQRGRNSPRRVRTNGQRPFRRGRTTPNFSVRTTDSQGRVRIQKRRNDGGGRLGNERTPKITRGTPRVFLLIPLTSRTAAMMGYGVMPLYLFRGRVELERDEGEASLGGQERYVRDAHHEREER